MTSENAAPEDAPAEMPGVEEIERLERALRYAATTASNDDYTKAGTVERTRHVDRVTAMLEAADALRAFAPILAEKESLRRELHSLAVALHRKHYWHVKQWKPFDDALGLATQIDNMTAGLVPEARALAAEAALAAERERCAKLAEQFESDADPDAGAVIAAAIRAEG